YGFVPRTSLDDTVKQQAFLKASKEFDKVMQTMSLEAQDLPESERKKLLEQMVAQVLESGSVWK
ncbi:MAG TPA: hypothetical protein DHV36_01815, partial [Desulfobacteraceae bacterium]|nr:hypothetical protein [Desulfobacteraceae bacterium]